MKYAYAAIFAAALARAQSLEDVPKCAIPCLDEAVKSETDCSVDDYACICPQFEAVQGAATGCVLEECGADVALNEVLPAVSALCENVGSPSDVPTTTEEPTEAPTEEPTEEPTEAPTEAPTEPAPTEEPTEEPTEPAPEPTVAPTTAPAPPAPTNGTNTNPPEPVPTAGAAAFAPLGGLALAGLLGLAL